MRQRDDAGAEMSRLPPAIEIFKARAEACAYLWSVNELDLHEAVDALWASAEQRGLVSEIGPDAVQAQLASAFRTYREGENV
jgi:hypothetical protein